MNKTKMVPTDDLDQPPDQAAILDHVVESLPYPFYVIDPQTFEVELANAAARSLGHPAARTCYMLTHGRVRPCGDDGLPCPLESVQRTGLPVRMKHVHTDDQGHQRHVEIHGYPLFDDGGNVSRIIEYEIDVTEQREAQNALLRSESLLRETQRIARVGGWELDLATSTVQWTDEVYLIHELPLSFEPTLESALNFYHPDDLPVLEAAIQRAADEGEPWDLELRLITAKNRALWVRAMGQATYDGERVVKLSGTFQDVTERKRGEQALESAILAAEEARRAEAQRRRVAEGLAKVLEDLNSDRSLEQVLSGIAAQARELLESRAVVISALGATIGEGVAYEDAMDPDFCASRDAMLTVMETGESLVVSKCAGSPALPVCEACGWQCRTLLAVPVSVQGEPIGAMLLYRDASCDVPPEQIGLAEVFANQVALALENARLRAQGAEAAAAAERNRLARDLHDSVTQTLFSASLVAESLPVLYRRNSARVEPGLEELSNLTHGALAEMRTLLVELRPAALLEGRLDELLGQLAAAITNRTKVDVVLDIDPTGELPPDVQVVFYRVAQEALNNVVKHATADKVSMTLRVAFSAAETSAADARPSLALTIRDNGKGFDPRDLHPDHLGVSIMHERATSIGAQLSVVSQPGEGTTVALLWPAGGQTKAV